MELVHEFNEHFLERLAETAIGEGNCLDIVRLHREQWLGLDPDARRQAAKAPLLLIDIHFDDEPWWQGARTIEAPPAKDSRTADIFKLSFAVELMHHALVLAWHAARWDSRVASILLAMSPQVATCISKLGLRDIRYIAENHHCHLRPRWEHLPLFWRHLLIAAGSRDHDAIHALHLHGWQLAGSASAATETDE